MNIGSGTTTSTYVGVKNTEISFNTLVNARFTGEDRGDIGVAPQDLRIANDIQLEDRHRHPQPTPFVNATFEGNILLGRRHPGTIPAGGFRHVDPKLEKDASGQYHLGAAAPPSTRPWAPPPSPTTSRASHAPSPMWAPTGLHRPDPARP